MVVELAVAELVEFGVIGATVGIVLVVFLVFI